MGKGMRFQGCLAVCYDDRLLYKAPCNELPGGLIATSDRATPPTASTKTHTDTLRRAASLVDVAGSLQLVTITARVSLLVRWSVMGGGRAPSE